MLCVAFTQRVSLKKILKANGILGGPSFVHRLGTTPTPVTPCRALLEKPKGSSPGDELSQTVNLQLVLQRLVDLPPGPDSPQLARSCRLWETMLVSLGFLPAGSSTRPGTPSLVTEGEGALPEHQSWRENIDHNLDSIIFSK